MLHSHRTAALAALFDEKRLRSICSLFAHAPKRQFCGERVLRAWSALFQYLNALRLYDNVMTLRGKHDGSQRANSNADR
jgi:hypothetical protein